jgi:hypothetical protein
MFIERRAVMVRTIRIVLGISALLTLLVGPDIAAAQQFSCKGQVVQDMPGPNYQPKPIDLSVTFDDKNKLSLAMANGKTLRPRISSNNKIQLKFVAKEFIGEYFHYTGDLFLIYNSGPLARLNCTRS